MAKEQFFDTSQDIGIYTDIELSDKKDKSNHRMYKTRCKVCGQIIYRVKYDLLKYNNRCTHGRESKNTEHNNEGYTFRVYGVPVKNSKCYSRKNKVYNLWRHMILRTTPKFWKEYPTYEGTTVSEEWRDFSIFYDDIPNLPGYDLWIKNTKHAGVMLDKDTRVPGSKHYSKDTCCFLLHEDSNRDVFNRNPHIVFNEEMIQVRKNAKLNKGKKLKAINKKTKEEYYFYSIKDCGKFLHTNPANIQMCLSDLPQYESHYSCKGHTFEYVSESDFEANLDKVIIYEVKEKPDEIIE